MTRGLIYIAVVPPWGTPDEPRHMEYVQLLYRKQRLVQWGDSVPEVEQSIIQSMDRHNFWQWGQSDFDPPYPGAVPERFSDIWPGGLAHQLHQPPLAYLMYASLLPLAASWSPTAQLYAMRLLSILLSTLVVLIAFVTADELFPDDDLLALSIPAFITFLPMHTFLTSGLSNDHLAEVGASITLLGLVLILKRGGAPLRIIGVVLAFVVTLLAKRTALVLIPTLATAMLLSLWDRQCKRNLDWRWVGASMGGGVLALLAGLLFLMKAPSTFPGLEKLTDYVRTAYLFLPTEPFPFSFEQPYLSSLALRLYVHYLDTIFESFWARFGWMNIRPSGIWYAAFGLISLAAIVGLGRLVVQLITRPSEGTEEDEDVLTLWQKQVILLFASSIVFMLALVIGREIRSWEVRWGGWPQARFLFPVIIPIATLLILGVHTVLPRRYRRRGLAGLIGFLVLADAMFMTRYIAPGFYGAPLTLAQEVYQPGNDGPGTRLPLVVRNYERTSITSTPTPTTTHITLTPTTIPTMPTATPTITPGEWSNPFGVTIQSGLNDQVQTLAQDAGVRWIRVGISWRSVEPEDADLRDPNNGNWPDSLLRGLETRGLSPVFLMLTNPAWASPTDCGPLYEEGYIDFREFVYAAAERYDGDGDYDGDGTIDGTEMPYVQFYEFYNEPDLDPRKTELRFGGCWGDKGTDYARLMREAYLAIKGAPIAARVPALSDQAALAGASPSATVMLGGLAYDSQYNNPDAPGPPCYNRDANNFFNYDFLDDILNTVFEDGTTGGDYFDAINFHYHRNASPCWAAWGLETLGKADYLQRKLAMYGYDGATKPRKTVAVTEDGEKRAPEPTYSDENQARYVVMSFIRALAGRFEVLTWFSLDYFEDHLERVFGLLGQDYSRKPGYAALEMLTTSFTEALFVRELGVDGVEGYVFAVDGLERTAAWTANGARTVSFSGKQVRVYDKYGNLLDEGSGALSVELTPDPVYVEITP